MKKVLLVAVALIAPIAFAAPASAAVVNVALNTSATVQAQSGASQLAVSLAGNVGSVGSFNDVTSTAANIGQNAMHDLSLDQGNGGFGNLAGVSSSILQVQGMVSQTAISVAGTGSAGNNNSVTGMAANLGQNAQTTVRITQR